MGFTAATYNVLASAYVRPQFFPHTPPQLLDPIWRRPAIARHVAALDADLICMQEVEVEMFEEIERQLAPSGYAGALALKAGGKPDGCAVFIRSGTFELVRVERLEYDDGTPEMPASGHVAQLAVLKESGGLLGVANTHLKWHPPGTPPERRYGLRQMRHLLDARIRRAPECRGWIVCGDFNVTSEDAVIEELARAGFAFSHMAIGGATCNSNRHAKMIDYLFHDAGLASTAVALPALSDSTPLPGPGEPSDHVAVTARLQWIEKAAGDRHAAN